MRSEFTRRAGAVALVYAAAAVAGCNALLGQVDGEVVNFDDPDAAGIAPNARDATERPDVADRPDGSDSAVADAAEAASDADGSPADVTFADHADTRPACPDAGCGPTLIASGQGSMGDIVLAKDEACWSFSPPAGSTLSGIRCTKRVGPVCDGDQCRIVNTEAQYASPIFAEDERFYWSNLVPHVATDILTTVFDGGAAQVWVRGQVWSSQMITTGDYIYWLNRDGDIWLSRSALAGSLPSNGDFDASVEILAQAAPGVDAGPVQHFALMVDAPYAYWTDMESDTVYRTRFDRPACKGDECLWLHLGWQTPTAITHDSTYIYVGVRGAILRIRKDCDNASCVETVDTNRYSVGLQMSNDALYFLNIEGTAHVIRRVPSSGQCQPECPIFYAAPAGAAITSFKLDDDAIYVALDHNEAYRIAK